MSTNYSSKNRAAFVAGVREGLYPILPKPIAATIDALDRLAEMEKEPAADLDTFCRATVDAMLAGKALPKNFGADALSAEQAGERQRAERTAIRTVREQLDARFATTLRVHLPEILSGLRAELSEVMDGLSHAAKAVGGLDLTSGESVAAATSSQRAAVVALDGLRVRYERLRKAQHDALTATSTGITGLRTRAVTGLDWPAVLDTGLVDFAEAEERGMPSSPHPLLRMLQVAGRTDAWVPTIADIERVGPQLGATFGQPIKVGAW